MKAGWKVVWLLLVLPLWTVAQCVTTLSSFPYSESFETGPGGWITGGTNNDWALGQPVKSTINSAGDGSSCWIIGGLAGSSYSGAQRSWLQSPCFDLTLLPRPELAFLIFWETEFQYDGGNLQYSLDGGITWRTLGSTSSGNCKSDHWYTISSITNLSGLANQSAGWSGTLQPTSGSCRGGNGSGGWVRARYCLQELQGQRSVRFRFTFGSGTTCNQYDGIAIDRFEIYDLPPRSTAIGFTCISSRTILFEDLQPDCTTSRQWDFGDGTNETNAAAVISHTYPSEGDWSVTLTAMNTCLGTEVTVSPARTLGYLADIRPVSCEGGTDGAIELTSLPASLAAVSVSWSDPLVTGWNPTGLSAGPYVFSLTAARSCSFTDTLTVAVDLSAAARPDLGPDGFFCPDRPQPLRPAASFVSYLWQDGSTADSLVPQSDGWYWVQALNSAGCSGSDSVFLELNCMDQPFFASAFTPNGDLLNDGFSIHAGTATLLRWMVYDRWGHVVFSSDNDRDVWDGNGCMEGVYTCLIQFLDADGLERYKAGRVTLIR